MQTLFNIKFKSQLHEFKVQTFGIYIDSNEAKIFECNSAKDFVEKIFTHVSLHLKREVIVNGEEFSWAEIGTPTINDIDKFVIIHDNTAKRYFSPSEVTSEMLQNKDKLAIYIYLYSIAISNAILFKNMKCSLLTATQTDRAGAAAIES
ncbi:hypothetical protein HK096_005160 [Nowakowskiella sp. JEL0078]|nr:hypothetical protein HK096_005160 [Nowakowskiella sp. JEL0078]